MSIIDAIYTKTISRNLDKQLEFHGVEKSDLAGLNTADKEELLRKFNMRGYYDAMRSVKYSDAKTIWDEKK